MANALRVTLPGSVAAKIKRIGMLRERLRPGADSQQRAVLTPQADLPRPCGRTPRTPIPTLLKLYWVMCAVLLLAVIQLGCGSHQADSSFTQVQTGLVQEDATAPVNEHSGSDLARSAKPRVETWIREDEPTIEVTGPVFEDPFADFAPRAVLERLPAPRTKLASSSVPRAELVRLPQ